ncbi:MAG TPA: hypothetical protein ENJ55_04265 [Rhizobiales bacterium]|nr:hypothetical protein [Hyphomicrobiales bacterium]
MRIKSNILPTATMIVVGLLTAGCSSGASVGNYLWGDDPAPSKNPGIGTSLTQPGQTGLPQAPAASTYSYTANSASSDSRLGFSKLPKNSQRVYVIVNDQPITGYDISQRIKLNQILGRRRNSRKDVLEELINDVIQISEAKKNKVDIDDRRIERAIGSMASSNGSSPGVLRSQLKKRGVSFSSLKRQVKASLALRWLMQKEGAKVSKVSDAEVERRLRKINSDPRRQGVTVYLIRQVNLPVEQTSSAMAPQLLQARAIEAQQISQRYRGCSSLRKASSNIYNVKITRTIQADSRKLPSQMRTALRKAGRKRLIGPMRTRSGIQMIAFCGTKRIQPPKISRDQVKNLVQNENFGQAADNILRKLRRNAFIDYKVASARP